eukprot:530024-Ditylum_brightwellii.AAC.1
MTPLNFGSRKLRVTRETVGNLSSQGVLSSTSSSSDSPLLLEPTTAHKGEAASRMPTMLDLLSAGLRRSPRLAQKAVESTDKPVCSTFGLVTMLLGASAIFWTGLHAMPATIQQRWVLHTEVVTSLFDETINEFHPMPFAVNQQQNETYTYRDMLKQPDYKDFIHAMLKEIEVCKGREHWTLMWRDNVPMEKWVNGKVKTILSIWNFKRKRFPSGELMKYKARLCVHGGMQQWGIDFWETYSPVVNWITIRTLLAVATIHELPTECIDFVLAFPQAKLDID